MFHENFHEIHEDGSVGWGRERSPLFEIPGSLFMCVERCWDSFKLDREERVMV